MSNLAPEQYKAILEGLGNGLYVVDQDRKIVFWNSGAEKLTGYHAHEVVGRNCQENLLAHCDENYQPMCGSRCPLRDTMSDGHAREAIVYLRHKDGQRVPVKIRAVPVRNADGMIVGAAESFEECHGAFGLPPHPNAQAVHPHPDGITGLPDRPSMESYFEASLRDYLENRTPFAVVVIEIDELESFRHTRGAAAETKLLHTVAATLSKSVRDGDLVGHWSGGKFLAILLNCPAAVLAQIVFRLRRLVSGTEISWWGDQVGVKVWVAGTVVRPDDTMPCLLERSEQALAACRLSRGETSDAL